MATQTSEKVMSMVERELHKDPGVDNQTLFDKAAAIDADVGKLTARQFNARYPLQVKRKMQSGNGKPTTSNKPTKSEQSSTTSTQDSRPEPTKGEGDSRQLQIRSLLIDLVQDVRFVDSPSFDGMMATVDDYADRISRV